MRQNFQREIEKESCWLGQMSRSNHPSVTVQFELSNEHSANGKITKPVERFQIRRKKRNFLKIYLASKFLVRALVDMDN